jgi:hypothetical protein
MNEEQSFGVKQRGFIYRCWDAEDNCLYVGQHTGIHPAVRIQSHRSKRWWPEVSRIDYVEVSEGEDLAEAEIAQIQQFNPRHNKQRTRCANTTKPEIQPRTRMARSFVVEDEDWDTFAQFVHDIDNVSASWALREFIRWYNGGCGDRLKLTVPILFPSEKPRANVQDMAGRYPGKAGQSG